MKIIAFTGAGISKQSNIPTFMERPDVREKLFRSYAQRHHEEYNEVIRQLKANMNGAKPNDAHYALAEYHVPIITMNIDGLHRLAGSDALELHGGLPEDDEMDIADYAVNFRRMFGNERMDAVMGSVEGTVRFYGLTETNMQLEGLDRHLRLIDSYKKLHKARAKFVGLNKD